MKETSIDKEYGHLMLIVKSRAGVWYTIMIFIWLIEIMVIKKYWQTQEIVVIGLGTIIVLLSIVLISMRHRKICFFEKGMIYKAI